MKIASTRLIDFRIFEDQLITFDEPMCIFRGPNHSGKTSLCQGIKLGISKCADGTDPRGAGANDKIRLGANKAIIENTIEGKSGPVLLRTQYGPGKTGRTQKIVAGSGGPETVNIGAAFDKYLDANQERLSCVLDSDYFVSQKPEAQKAILASLVLPATHDFEPDMVDMAEKHLGRFEWGKSPVAVIDQVYDAAYSARREEKSALGAIRIPPKPSQPLYPAGLINEKLVLLRANAAKETKKVKGGGTVQVGRIEQALESEREKLTTAQTDYSEFRRASDELSKLLLDGPTLKKHERAAAGRTLWNQLQSQMAEFDREIEANEEAQQIYRDLGANPHCPTCTQKITKEFIAGKVEEHGKLITAAKEAKDGLTEEQKALGDIEGAEAAVAAHKANTEKFLVNARVVTASSERTAAAQAAITRLEGELDQAKAAESEPVDTSALDKINAEIAEWETHLSPALNYAATLAQIETLSKQWEAQKLKINDLETLCQFFGKDGIKAELIAQHIGEFSETVNRVLSAWGYSAKLEIEPYSFLVTTPEGELPLKELSGSERLMFAVALQTAIAVHGKIRMIVVDRLDTMIDQERGRALGCIKGLLDAGTLDQAIVMLADNNAVTTQKAGVATYRVEEGKVTRL